MISQVLVQRQKSMHEQSVGKAADVLELFLNEDIAPETRFQTDSRKPLMYSKPWSEFDLSVLGQPETISGWGLLAAPGCRNLITHRSVTIVILLLTQWRRRPNTASGMGPGSGSAGSVGSARNEWCLLGSTTVTKARAFVTTDYRWLC